MFTPSRRVASQLRITRLIAAAVVGLTPLAAVHADTWVGGGADGNWSTQLNWSGGVAPVAGAALVFDGTAQLSTNNDYTADTQFTGVSFAPTAGAFTLAGASIDLGGDLVNNSTSAQSITLATLHLMQDTNFLAAGSGTNGTFSIGSAIDGGVSGTVNLNLAATSSGVNTLSGIISNGSASSFNVNVASGIWSLTNTNTFGGTVSLTGGTLRANDGAGLSSSALLTLNGGILESSSSLSRNLGTAPGQVQLLGGATGFSANGGGVNVTLNSANSTLVWGTTPGFTPGTLTLQASSANQPLALNNGIDLNGAVRTIAVNNSNATNSATINGTVTDSVGGGGLNKVGNGLLVIASAGTIPTTTATGGSVSFPAGYVAGNYVMNGGSVLLTPNSGNVTIGGSITGTASGGAFVITANTPADSTMTLSGSNTFASGLTLSAGTLMVNGGLGSGTGTLTLLNNTGTDKLTTLMVSGAAVVLNNPVLVNTSTSNTIGINFAGNNNLTLNGTVISSASHGELWNKLSPGSTLTFNGEVDLSNSTSERTLHLRGSGTTVFSGPINNAPAGSNTAKNCTLEIDGGQLFQQVVTINSTSLTYTGGTTITGGTVIFNASGFLPPTVENGVTTQNAYIAVSSVAGVGYAGGIQDPTFLSRLAGSNKYANNVTANSMASGALCVISNADASTNVNFTSAPAFAASGASIGSWGSMSLGAANGAFTYTGTLTPLANANGTNIWRLGGGNGTLTLAQVMGDGAAPGATLTVNGGNNGALVLTGQSTYTGNTTLSLYQTLKNGVDNALGQTGTLTVGSTSTSTSLNLSSAVYDMAGFNQNLAAIRGFGVVTSTSGAPTLALNAGSTTGVSFDGQITGSVAINKGGGGIQILTGTANNYTGTTTVSAGVLRANQANLSSSNLVLNGGLLESSVDVTRAPGTGANQIQLPGGTSGFSARGGGVNINLGGAGATLAWGSAAFNPGTLTLQASTADSPLTLVNGLDLGGGARAIATGSANSSTITGAISDSIGGGGLVKSGAGTLALQGSVTYAGPTSIAAGKLSFASATPQAIGAVSGAGALQVAAGTTLTSDGVVGPTWQIDGTHLIRPNGTTAGTSLVSSLIIAGAPGAWTGHLNLANNALIVQSADTTSKAAALSTLLDQLANTSGGTVGITSSSVAADPSHKALFAVDNALLGKTLFGGQPADSNSILVEATYKGDANLDRKVDVIDLGVLATNYGTSTTGGITKGDYNQDGKVDVIDLGILATDYGLGTTGGGFTLQQAIAQFPQLAGGASAVPEPASLAVLVLGSAALLGRRRRR